jgi:hypothetical protein
MMQPQTTSQIEKWVEPAIFQVTTDLNSERPDWMNLSFLPDRLYLPELMQYIPLTAINQVRVSKALAQQLTWVKYTDRRGNEQTLVFKIRNRAGKAAGEQFKTIYRQLLTAKPKPTSY